MLSRALVNTFRKPGTRSIMSTQVAQQQMKTTGKMEVPTGKQQLHVWQEHEQVRALIRRVIDLTDMDEKQRQFNLLVKELSQHEVAEEVVIHPAYRNLTSDESTVNQALEQETSFQRVLYDLDQRYGTKIDSSVNAQLENALGPLNDHIEFEQSKILPVLEQRLSKDDIDSLNSWFNRVKTMAPTRPHPDGPKSAVGNLMAAPLVTFIDKFRDLGKSFA